jgi:hypothetical protein
MNPRVIASIVVLAGSVLMAWPARAEVPTAADFAACNMKAAEEAAADAASASPRTETTPRAGQLPSDARPTPPAGAPRGDVVMPPSPAGKAGATPVLRDPTGNTLSSDKDPQIEGLAADRANDRSYVAAYRSCMRQRGF